MGAFFDLTLILFCLIPNQPTSAVVPVIASLSELHKWQDIAKAREDEIEELESINLNMRHEYRILSAVCFFFFFYTFGEIDQLFTGKRSLERCYLKDRTLQGAN